MQVAGQPSASIGNETVFRASPCQSALTDDGTRRTWESCGVGNECGSPTDTVCRRRQRNCSRQAGQRDRRGVRRWRLSVVLGCNGRSASVTSVPLRHSAPVGQKNPPGMVVLRAWCVRPIDVGRANVQGVVSQDRLAVQARPSLCGFKIGPDVSDNQTSSEHQPRWGGRHHRNGWPTSIGLPGRLCRNPQAWASMVHKRRSVSDGFGVQARGHRG